MRRRSHPSDKMRENSPVASQTVQGEATAQIGGLTSSCEISNSSLRRPASHVTLRDIAKELGISHVSVSLALRDEPGISESLRRQVCATAEEMGYRRDPVAAALGQRRSAVPARPFTGILAWIKYGPPPQPLLHRRELALYWQGAHTTAQEHGYRLEEFFCDPREPFEHFTQSLKAQGVLGILILSNSAPPKVWESLNWNNFIVVRLGGSVERTRYPMVAGNLASNCQLAFERAQALGYLRLGFVTDRRSRGRLSAGFLTTQENLPEHQRIPIHYLINSSDTIVEQLRLDQWIEKHRPDAILTEFAIVPEILKRGGHRVPADLGVVTSNILTCEGLAGIDQKPVAIGNAAVDMLLLQMSQGNSSISQIHRELLITGEWVDGPSLPPRMKPRQKA